MTNITEKTHVRNKVLLTHARWAGLTALRRNPSLMTRPFLGQELIVTNRHGKLHPAPGPLVDSLRKAGWLEQVPIENSLGEDSLFRLSKMPNAWMITDAGRLAVAACPEFYPGKPAGATDPDDRV